MKNTAIGLAVVSFYLLDFALNALQASLRNLLLDVVPAGQLNAGNAWHGRMTNAGNIIGFGFGNILPQLARFILLIGPRISSTGPASASQTAWWRPVPQILHRLHHYLGCHSVDHLLLP